MSLKEEVKQEAEYKRSYGLKEALKKYKRMCRKCVLTS